MVGKGDKQRKKTYPQSQTADRSYRFIRDQTAETALLLAPITGQARRLLPYHFGKIIAEMGAAVKGRGQRGNLRGKYARANYFHN